jgi:flagellar assembly factor FliW
MKIENSRFGTIEYADEAVIDFPHGVIGLPQARRYILLSQGDAQAVGWLQSVDAPEIALPVVSAHSFPVPYPDVPLTGALTQAGLEPFGENIAILAVMVAAPEAAATVNLLAPIVIDADRRVGAQIILQGSRFGTRELLVFQADSHAPESNLEEARAPG